eukprot:2392092-Pyramimonas_sp.AAC.3
MPSLIVYASALFVKNAPVMGGLPQLKAFLPTTLTCGQARTPRKSPGRYDTGDTMADDFENRKLA